jgi:murein DD-endopeptidase MepM/ murein hydrolase activator NlpD
MKYWPLKNCLPLFPDSPGRFAAKRSHDFHTGIDLYCELGQEIVAIEDGIVITIEPFTGGKANCAWWNDTQAILVHGESGVINYAEVTPIVRAGDFVMAGQVIAVVDTAVLRSFKGRPMVMLHLELLAPEVRTSPWWIEGDKPESIWNPEPMLEKIAGESLKIFDLSKYDGESYKDPVAPDKDSDWWHVWKK